MLASLKKISPMKKMTKMNCCVLCIILGFIVGMLYARLRKRREGMENKMEKYNNAFVYCHMKGCPHCEKVTPEWDEFNEKHDGNYNGIKIMKVENKEDPEFMKKHNIKGFPSFVHVDENGKGKQVEERKMTAWEKFLDMV